MRSWSIAVFLIFVSTPVSGASAPVSGKVKELREFFGQLPESSKGKDWYGTPSEDTGRCGVGISNTKDSSSHWMMNLFKGDINNDGKDEFILVNRCGGSLRTDTIVEVFQRDGSSYRSLEFDSMLERNGLDGSKIPLHIGSPFLGTKEGKVVVHFKDETWIWEKDKFQEIKAKKRK